MVVYNFKSIMVVPNATDFIDVVLSKTQRKTPTVVHPAYQISRIRTFYMRKVKFMQQTVHDKLSMVLEQFPLLTDIHPFYADLINILYDRDHYKLALGQLNTARHLVDQIANDYLKLLKYGDSLYRCKQLKRAAMGRICTLLKKQQSSLAYLEQVRQHLSRLPSIDPNTRTLVLCGYPNVGKSSFLNKMTRADVEVQPYPFTTKSLFVGHTDYEYLKWQVIDTPGILDHPLEERNTIEMQSITALAHLRAAILFMVDISENCGYSLQQQANLFHSIKPLFTGKPLLVVANKIDVIPFEELDEKSKKIINSMTGNGAIPLIPMSTMTEEGIASVKKAACDTLLASRVEAKMSSKKSEDILQRLNVAMPHPRDEKTRTPSIPQSILENRGMKGTSQAALYIDEFNQKEEEKPMWLKGFSSVEWKKKYKLKDDEWRFDVIPELMDGHNISDWIDPEILSKLEALEKEEDARIEAKENEMEEESEEDLTEEQWELAGKIKEKKQLLKMAARDNKSGNAPVIERKVRSKQRSISEFEDHLGELGIDTEKAAKAMRERSVSREPRKRERSSSVSAVRSEIGRSTSADPKKRRMFSKSPGRGEGFATPKQLERAVSVGRKNQKYRNIDARKGEGDRHVPDLKPKHLFSGKRKGGTHDRR
eukprot:TRINITY_DN331_c0_g1_i1.p1 TRINITY_DN331_c0_g1~~TRINITY_DN331_c0_g1_i1.p1  ORF type:complete len:652 (+),score=265.57 TRINITY_DN331_c0_g1_i1:222-2177(+)